MNKLAKIIIIGVIAIVLIVIIAVLIIKLSNKEDDHKKLEITKEINAGIPFKWDFEIEDESIVKFDKSYVIRDDNKGGIVGASVYTNYVFRGLKEGTTKVTFKFVSITEDNYPEEKDVYNIKVDKDLNISLVGITE